MNNDFRQRVFLPIVLPLLVVAGFIGFAFALSRVLLAVPEMAATTIALGVAAYVLLIAAVVTARPRITSRALAVGVTIALVAVGASGVVAGAAGMRDLHAEDAAHAGEGEGEGGGAPEDAFVAVDIDFESAPETLPAGDTTITLINNGGSVHNVTIRELDDEVVVEAQGGETAEGTAALEAGQTYYYYCSIPGHEDLMNGELTAE